MSATMSSTTSSAEAAIDDATSSMVTSFTIESIDVSKVYVRNTGQNTITSLSVYVNGVPVSYIVAPSQISSGQIGTITIYDFIAEGDMIKIVSPNGFSTAKAAPDSCKAAAACWHFDEGSGSMAYDSSPNSNTGTLVNGPAWTSGKYGGALTFDGSNDYVDVADSYSLGAFPSGFSVTLWIKSNSISNTPISRWGPNNGYGLYTGGSWYMGNGTWVNIQSGIKPDAQWHFYALVWNGTHMSSFFDTALNTSTVLPNPTFNSPSGSRLMIGADNRGPGGYFNGTIDEVRIYSKAIY